MTIHPLLTLLSGFPGLLFLPVGAFYAFGGWFAARHFLVEVTLDRALAVIGSEAPDRAERLRLGWLLLVSVVTFASGVALALQSSLAIWLFVTGVLQQAVHIFLLGPRVFYVDEGPDPADRQKTVNAAIIYSLVAVGVIWAGTAGRLLPVTGAGTLPTLATAVAAAGFAGWIARHVWGPAGDRPEADDDCED